MAKEEEKRHQDDDTDKYNQQLQKCVAVLFLYVSFHMSTR